MATNAAAVSPSRQPCQAVIATPATMAITARAIQMGSRGSPTSTRPPRAGLLVLAPPARPRPLGSSCPPPAAHGSNGAAGPVPSVSGPVSGPGSRSTSHSVIEQIRSGRGDAPQRVKPGGGPGPGSARDPSGLVTAGPRASRRLLFGSVTQVTQIHDMTVVELAAAIREGQLSPVEITDHYLERIDRHSGQVGAFYTVTNDLARQEAVKAEKAAADRRRDPHAELPPLTGVPIPIKDLNMVAGVRMTLGSL